MIITIASADGSPGATTTALGLALQWPRPVLVLENAIGSPILAGYLRGQVPHDRGLLSLLAGHRDGVLGSALDLAAIQIPGHGDVQLIPGFTDSAQAGGPVREMWAALREPLVNLALSERDVIVDAGRPDSTTFPTPLLAVSDRVLFVARTSLRSIAGAKCVVPSIRRRLRDENPDSLQTLIVGERQPYPARSVCDALDLPLGGQVAWDPKSAAVLSDGDQPGRKNGVSDLQRSLSALTRNLQQSLTAVGGANA